MLKAVITAIALAPASLMAAQLHSFESIKQALDDGEAIRVAIDFSLCTPAMPIKGYVQPNDVITTHKQLMFADHHFTLNNPLFIGKPVIEQVSYQINREDVLSISTTMLNAKDFTVLKPAQQTTCHLNVAAQFYNH